MGRCLCLGGMVCQLIVQDLPFIVGNCLGGRKVIIIGQFPALELLFAKNKEKCELCIFYRKYPLYRPLFYAFVNKSCTKMSLPSQEINFRPLGVPKTLCLKKSWCFMLIMQQGGQI
uniref:Uncharacterized protein n=1 Tax=Cacopsylla melanoneura TaxID=428564 RepID=A0A8D8RJ93_9HEMI